ncbi:hypothetical protein ASPBRDRAFT_511698 [Aspergillus brasiliensis CBS 101740]|uniref:Uncharacterized protein n=1 Tax=Aspergillus brasiliensis (strain CBS 101740 / IMI 381727 / IBT 21946) TaxID=767769 RepID=A0A1L9UPR2_ASPBC|nr:hypothetical protein ASPBRDRAFT_511698 [Aspergillus brasiliensis CBS 101740]
MCSYHYPRGLKVSACCWGFTRHICLGTPSRLMTSHFLWAPTAIIGCLAWATDTTGEALLPRRPDHLHTGVRSCHTVSLMEICEGLW